MNGRARLDEMVSEIAAEPHRVRVHFPAAAREVGRGPVDPDVPSGPRLEDNARAELLLALAAALDGHADRLAQEVLDLYRFGDADEKRAVLSSLHHLDLGTAALPLVEDALRTNDTRLLCAALGPYATEYLPSAVWRHGVLKCLFVGVPLVAVHGLQARADEELFRMVAAYAEERRAAGRSVPSDARLLLGHEPQPLES